MKYTLKVRETPAAAEMVEIEKSVMNMYGHDWMTTTTTMDVGPPSSPACCTRSTTTRPLKTLQLFPITFADLKADQDHHEEGEEEESESTPSNPTD